MSEWTLPSPAHLVRSFYAAINARHLQMLDTIVDADFDPHIDRAERGLDTFKHVLLVYLNGFSGFCNRVEQLLIDGDYVTARVRTCGIHTGTFLGHTPSRRPFTVSAIEVFRVNGSRIAERWSAFDTIAMLMQLGLYAPASMSSPMPVPAPNAPAMESSQKVVQPAQPAQLAQAVLLSFDNQLFSVGEQAKANA